MRTHPRHPTAKMIWAEVPRNDRGELLLCHFCQRAVYHAGGLDRLLITDLRHEAVAQFNRQRTDYGLQH